MTYSDLTYGRQRLAGASLLVFLNKADVTGGMLEDEVRNVCLHTILPRTCANTPGSQT
jgi:hypothetical protein